MISFICLFFPAVVSVWIFRLLSKRREISDFLFRYCFNNLIINGICFAIKSFILSTGAQPLYSVSYDMTPDVAVRYIIMALPVAVFIALVEFFATKNVKVIVDDENKEDEKE